MLLPQTAEYALRAMAQLATLPEGEPVRTADLAREAGIPESYLSKIMRRLVAEGLLTSEKGHGGGFKLRHPPEKVRFIDILRALDVDLEENRCAFGWDHCSDAKPCVLHPAFVQLKEEHIAWATRTTLAGLAAKRKLEKKKKKEE